MARAMMILVCDDHQQTESARTFGRNNGIEVQVYSSAEWNHRINDPNFRAQLTGGSSTLAVGTSPVDFGAKILPFPGGGQAGQQAAQANDKRVQTINELESHAIEKAIYEYNGNLTEAAKALGIGRATLYRKVKQYNIDPSQARRKRAA